LQGKIQRNTHLANFCFEAQIFNQVVIFLSFLCPAKEMPVCLRLKIKKACLTAGSAAKTYASARSDPQGFSTGPKGS
jgi:hypothetical protein